VPQEQEQRKTQRRDGGSGEGEGEDAGQVRTLDILGATSTWTLATKGMGAAMNTNCNPR
jgi:hypothetical protein